MWAVCFWAISFLVPLPWVVSLVTRLWQHEQYHFLPVLWVLLSSLFLARWDRIVRMPGSVWTRIVIVVAGGIVLAAIWQNSPWLGTLAWVLVWCTFLNSQFGSVNPKVRSGYFSQMLFGGDKSSVAGLWPLPCLFLPLPLGFDQKLMDQLLLLTAHMSSYVLDLLSLPHLQAGNLIEFRNTHILVAQLCEGVQSPFTLLFLATLMLVLFRRSPWLLPVYFGAALLWTLFMNIMRVVSTGVIDVWYAWEWTGDWQRSLLSYLCLAVATLLLLSTDRLLQVVFFPTKPDLARNIANPFISFWNILFGQRVGA